MNRLAAMDAFVRVVDTGSFTSAARQLRVGQPAISKIIAQLEDRVGVRLLLRSPRGLAPTEAGETFYEHAKRSVEEADEAELKARGVGATLSGRLRIGGSVTFSRLHVVPRLRKFMAMHPALDIEMFLDDRDVDLVEAGIDIALRMGDLQSSSLTARKIGSSKRVVVGAPSYFEDAGIPDTPADLATHQSVTYDRRGGGVVWTFTQGATETAVTLAGRLRLTAAEGVREAVLSGIGLAVASEWMFSPEIASGSVARVLTDWSLPNIDLWAVFPTGRNASMKARAFASFIEQELGPKFSNKRRRPAANGRRQLIERPAATKARHRIEACSGPASSLDLRHARNLPINPRRIIHRWDLIFGLFANAAGAGALSGHDQG